MRATAGPVGYHGIGSGDDKGKQSKHSDQNLLKAQKRANLLGQTFTPLF